VDKKLIPDSQEEFLSAKPTSSVKKYGNRPGDGINKYREVFNI